MLAVSRPVDHEPEDSIYPNEGGSNQEGGAPKKNRLVVGMRPERIRP